MRRPTNFALLWLTLALAAAVLVGCNGHLPPSGPPKVAQPGDLVWGYRHNRETHFTPLSVVDRMAYFGSDDHYVYAVDVESRKIVWRFQTGGGVHSAPGVAHDVVYVASADSYVYALDAASGTLRWRYDTGGGLNNTPAVDGGIVYFGSIRSHVYALNAATGELVWRTRTGGAVFSSRS